VVFADPQPEERPGCLLNRSQRPWARQLGGSLRDLELPSGIGDEHPGDGVEPGGLMPDLHGLPGLGIGPFIGGYSDLIRWLTEDMKLRSAEADRPGNLIAFGYDWRLSNRYSAGRLKDVAERELHRWRRDPDGHPEAKLVLICHSMGGLVARYYLEVLGGAEWTRTLVTVGTPHRRSLKALNNLVNGLRLRKGPFSFDVSALARSFPSTYELLPGYRCIETGDGRQDLSTAKLARLDGDMLGAAVAFHREIDEAVAANGTSPYRLRMVVGTRQPTVATANVVGHRVEPLMTIDGNDERGDGTVPRFASIPVEVEPDDLRQLNSSQRHGYLQQHGAILDDVQGILTAKDVRYMADAPDLPRQPGIELPEVLNAGDPLTIVASSSDGGLLLEARLTDEDGRFVGRPAIFENLGDHHYEAELTPPHEGIYTVTVAGVRDASLEPVSEALLVADAETVV
jgi:pimeloyl-ACP methyl ester carboxylesterase